MSSIFLESDFSGVSFNPQKNNVRVTGYRSDWRSNDDRPTIRQRHEQYQPSFVQSMLATLLIILRRVAKILRCAKCIRFLHHRKSVGKGEEDDEMPPIEYSSTSSHKKKGEYTIEYDSREFFYFWWRASIIYFINFQDYLCRWSLEPHILHAWKCLASCRKFNIFDCFIGGFFNRDLIWISDVSLWFAMRINIIFWWS